MSAKSIQQCMLAVAMLLQGCATARSGLEPTPAGRTPTAACAAGTAVPEKLLEPGSLLLFGEIHGVQELPSFFGEAVCSTADARLPMEVGLEVPKTEQASIDTFLASPGAPSDVETLIATAFWSRDAQDGRSSQAMVALLERIRQLRAQGLPIDVFLFDLDGSQAAAERDKVMAENLSSHVRAHPKALTMALTGEVHAWKTKGSPWDPDFLPMGWYLASGGLDVHSLGRSTPAGTAWNCVGPSPGDCRIGETKATAALPSGQTAGIELLPQPSKRGYDGLYGTSSLTASPPAQSHETQG
jgi:hypothetical protein